MDASRQLGPDEYIVHVNDCQAISGCSCPIQTGTKIPPGRVTISKEMALRMSTPDFAELEKRSAGEGDRLTARPKPSSFAEMYGSAQSLQPSQALTQLFARLFANLMEEAERAKIAVMIDPDDGTLKLLPWTRKDEPLRDDASTSRVQAHGMFHSRKS